MKKLALPIVLVLLGAASLITYFQQPGGKGNIEVKIENTPVVMPAAYKVYGNKQALAGKYYLFKMLLTNHDARTIQNLKVEYRIPGYIQWTELARIAYLYPGQSSVVVCYPKFNDNIVEKTTASQEKTDIRVTYAEGQPHEVDESFGFTMEGRNDMVYTSIPSSEVDSYADLFDNVDLLPSFVTPDDPIVKYFTQQIQEKVLKGEAASVFNTPKECLRFMEGIYKATEMAHMVYSGTSGVPENFGDVHSSVQRIRLPREVITGKTGLCIELTLMYASIMEDAGLHALIYLAPGHAYPGFELNGRYYAIESTGIGGEGLGKRSTVEEALKAGTKNLQELIKGIRAGDQRYAIIDVNKLNADGVVPMEMKDDDYLRKKVDEIAKSFEQQPQQRQPVQQVENTKKYVATTTQGRTNQGQAGNSGMARYSGAVSFTYPSFWSRVNSPLPQLPVLLTEVHSPDQLANAEVYLVQGTSSPQQAFAYLRQLLAQLGMQVQYSLYGTSGGYQIYQGQTYSSTGTYQWIGVAKPTSGGVTAVVAGASSQAYGRYQQVLKTIISSVQ